MDYIINEEKAKAAVFDYLMSKMMDKDFESVAAVAGDVMNIVFNKDEIVEYLHQ
jgi:hypothetical protein